MKKEERMKSESIKKPYGTPKLSVYGNIREITQDKERGGRLDHPGDDDKTG